MRFDEVYLQSVIRSIEKRIALTKINLTGLTVLTEAASGAYAVTPLIAAMAGAGKVIAYTKDSRFGKREDVLNDTERLIHAVGRPLPITVINSLSADAYAAADIITNSGHLRPIRREHVVSMKPTAVIPLMYERWELRAGDIDLDACREYGIKIAGTNEHHWLLNIFSFLGPLVVKALHDIFIPVMSSRVVVLSNNSFGFPVVSHLLGNGAEVFCVGPADVFSGIDGAVVCGGLEEAARIPAVDACVVATTPSTSNALTYDRQVLSEYVSAVKPTVCVHVWGDIDYEIVRRSKVYMVPSNQPRDGHQGLVMSGIGPEPVIRLIVGGLKVAEVLARDSKNPFDVEFCQMEI